MSEWISVEGGNLPPKTDNGQWGKYLVSVVLTYTDVFDYEENNIVTSALYDHDQKIWHLDTEQVINALRDYWGDPLCGDYVTHWMPLPEPPEKRVRG